MKKTNALRLLDQQKIAYKTLEYSYNAEDLSLDTIAQDNGLELEVVFKTLVLRGDKTGVIVALISGIQSLSLKKLAQVSGNKKVEMLAVKELQNLTGYQRGGCSPIGMKKEFPVYLDETASLLEEIYVNAGARGLLFGIKPKELLLIAKANLANIGDAV